MKRLVSTLLLISLLLSFVCGCDNFVSLKSEDNSSTDEIITLDNLPLFDNKPYVIINGNEPYFTKEELSALDAYEHYSELDNYGRCGVAVANIGKELMPTEERGNIGAVKPSGWQTAKYDNVDGKYLYNRCHLIGFQLTGENANEKNLITGTRYMNVDGMLPFENMVADYIKETKNHVLYRVTPIFKGANLVANGVLMEAYSIKDKGDGIKFCVYCYNAQPDIYIHYLTGLSCPIEEKDQFLLDYNNVNKVLQEYVLNTNSKKFHKTTCPSIKNIKDENKVVTDKARGILIKEGYEPCKSCCP